MAQPTQERLVAQLEKPQQTSGNVGHAGSGVGPENSPHYDDHEDDHVHHVAMSTYYVVFGLLMFLLFITVGAWYFDQHIHSLGHLSTPIAMAIAVAKALAIVLFFMHVKFSSRLVQIFACTGVAFVFIMFLLTFNDYGTREWLPRAGVYNDPTTSNSQGEKGDSSGVIIRASSVGAAPNNQGTPADNMMGSAMTAPGNAGQTAVSGGTRINSAAVLGADVRIVPNTGGAMTTSGAVLSKDAAMQGSAPQSAGSQGGASATTVGEQSGSRGGAGMDSGRSTVATNGSASNPGPIVGGAANNSFGSAAQSGGIEPKPATR